MTFVNFNIGDKLRPTAAQANAWNDAAIANKQNRNNPLNPLNTQLANATRLPVSNGSGTELPAFSVLQLTGAAVDPSVNEAEFLNHPAFAGGEVTTSDTGKFAITQQYLPDTVVDPNAVVAGVSFARLTGATGRPSATPVSGQSTLETGSSGPCIILYDPGITTAERIGIVRIGGGGGTSQSATIRFTILSASFSVGLGVLGCDYVNVIVTHVSCGYTGVAVGDEVQVFDPEYCHFNLPIELLAGLRGTATLMDAEFFQYGLNLNCIYETIQNQSCIWMIDNLCCAEEEIIV